MVGLLCVFRQADVVPWLWKLDIDSAFRRIPLAAIDLWAAWIAFLLGGEVIFPSLCGLLLVYVNGMLTGVRLMSQGMPVRCNGQCARMGTDCRDGYFSGSHHFAADGVLLR